MPRKKSNKQKSNKQKPLQKRYSTRFLSVLWPPINKRGYPFSKRQLVYEYDKKYVKGNNRYGVGPELGAVVDPDYGTKMLVLFCGEKEPEVISKSNVRACPFGPLFPNADAQGGGMVYKFVKTLKGGGMVSRHPTVQDKSTTDDVPDSKEKAAAVQDKSTTDDVPDSKKKAAAVQDKSTTDDVPDSKKKAAAVQDKSTTDEDVADPDGEETSDADEENVQEPKTSPYLVNLADVLKEHGINAKKQSSLSSFIAKIAQVYHSYGAYSI